MTTEENTAQLEAIATADAHATNAGLPSYSQLLASHEHDERNRAKTEENIKHARDQARAKAESIAELVAAMACDRDRLEELREEKRPYCAGWNMPGYMPDVDAETFETFGEAAEYIADQMEEAAEALEGGAQSVNDDVIASHLRNAAEALRNMDAPANANSPGSAIHTYYGETVGNYHYFITSAEFDGMGEDDFTELRELEEAAGEYETEDDAREAIQEHPLSVQVRSDWYSPGETPEPAEFEILLCTGGPAVRIVGELDQYRQPCRAWLEYQDWFTAWTEYHGEGCEHDTLLAYCQQFYFGE